MKTQRVFWASWERSCSSGLSPFRSGPATRHLIESNLTQSRRASQRVVLMGCVRHRGCTVSATEDPTNDETIHQPELTTEQELLKVAEEYGRAVFEKTPLGGYSDLRRLIAVATRFAREKNPDREWGIKK